LQNCPIRRQLKRNGGKTKRREYKKLAEAKQMISKSTYIQFLKKVSLEHEDR
jgi:hypothetical protein